MTKTLLITAAAVMPLTASIAWAEQAPKSINRNDYIKTVDVHFNQIDANHDGKVTKVELTAEMRREMQIANARLAQQLQMKFRQLDTNHDGQLSLQEFMAIQPSIRPSETPDQVLQRLDTNHDGTVSAEEFRAPEIAKFNRLDTNHDGVLTPAEIQAANGHK